MILSGDFLKLYIAKLEFTIICVNIKIKERNEVTAEWEFI